MTRPVQIRSSGDSTAPYDVHASEGFAAWLHATGSALAITTYQIGKLFLIAADSPDTLTVSERSFERAMGVAQDGAGGLLLAGRNAIWKLGNVVPKGQEVEGHDAILVPRQAWFTGNVFAHDVAAAPNGHPIFVNTLFSCLATVDATASFRSLWAPPFISRLTPEDRCHLNGLAVDPRGYPRYVTAAAQTDTAQGWREARAGGGVVMTIDDGTIVCDGLCMPHSPRLHDGVLYVLNAGSGELGSVDLIEERFEPLAFLPGFARGLAFVGHHALVGLSLPRAHKAFSGLPLEQRLKSEGYAPQCAIAVVNLQTGHAEHVLRLGGVVRELYDIALLQGLRKPMLVGLGADGALDHLITRGPDLDIRNLDGSATGQE